MSTDHAIAMEQSDRAARSLHAQVIEMQRKLRIIQIRADQIEEGIAMRTGMELLLLHETSPTIGEVIDRLRAENAELRAALSAMLHGLRVPQSQADHDVEREEASAMARAVLARIDS